MKNGFIIEVAKFFVEIFKKTNIVEGLKYLFGKINPDRSREYKSLAIDVFKILKWVTLVLLWSLRVNTCLSILVTLYLIWSNLFTYFYYHVWNIKNELTKERIQRRFVSLVLAFIYSNASFAYLYDVSFRANYKIKAGFDGELSFTLFSTYNSLFSDYKFIEPLNNWGSLLCSIQLIITFVFATIILSNSIPTNNGETE